MYRFGPFSLDPAERRLLRDSTAIPLSLKAFEVLHLLVQNSGHVVHKDDLLRQVWRDAFVEENNLTQSIYTLRKILEDGQAKYIETVPKIGYRFIAQVKEIRPSNSALVQIRSLAVLPFRTLIANSGDEYLALGITNDLIGRLSELKDIHVTPASSIFKYALTNVDGVAAGRELNVGAILEGNIQRQGDRVRVTIQFLDVAKGEVGWTERFDEKASDIFAMQDSISQKVAADLALKVGGVEGRLLSPRYTENAKAYDLYLQGRYCASRWTREGLLKGLELLGQAIVEDPSYALAHATLAEIYFYCATIFMLPSKALPRMKGAALKAVQADPDLAEAHAVLAAAREYWDWNFPEAEREYKRALELKPTRATTHLWYGLHLVHMGRTEESLAVLGRAQQLDPTAADIAMCSTLPLFQQREFAAMIDRLQTAICLNPYFPGTYYTLGWAYSGLRDFEKAIAALEQACQMDDAPVTKTQLAYVYGISGNRSEALRLLEQLQGQAEQTHVSSYDVGIIHLGLGDTERALKCFEAALEEKSVWMIRMNFDSRLDPVRSEPRVKDIIRRIGLPPHKTLARL